jgi:hypothetical protein
MNYSLLIYAKFYFSNPKFLCNRKNFYTIFINNRNFITSIYLVAESAVNSLLKDRNTLLGTSDSRIVIAEQKVAALPNTSSVKAMLQQQLNNLIG